MIIILSLFYSIAFLTGAVSAFTSCNVLHKKHTSYKNPLQFTTTLAAINKRKISHTRLQIETLTSAINKRKISYTRLQIATTDEETLTTDTDIDKNKGRSISFGKHDVLGSTQIHPQPRSLEESPTLLNAFVTNTHPQQTQDEQQ